MQAHLNQKPLFFIGVAVAGLTAFYMMRCVLVAFFGKPRTIKRKRRTSASEMLLPLIILALFSVFLGAPKSDWLAI